jgi:hypothetical protein
VDVRVKTDGLELIGAPLRGAANVGFVFRVGADAGNPQQFGEPLHGAIDVFIDFVKNAIEGGRCRGLCHGVHAGRKADGRKQKRLTRRQMTTTG